MILPTTSGFRTNYGPALVAWGYNDLGTIGNGTSRDVRIPFRVGSNLNWKTADVGGAAFTGVRNNGTLWTWGYNNLGRLGLGDTTNRSSPVQVGTGTNWSSVARGNGHAFAITTGNALWAWGQNTNGKLGIGDSTQRSSPVQVGTDSVWSSVSAGGDHTLALRTDGTLWVWGSNLSGQLGLGVATTSHRSSPVQIGSGTGWTVVEAGAAQSFAINGGALWAWGLNTNGRLGLNVSTASISSPVQVGALTTWKQVSSTSQHTLAVKTDGTLWAWGYGNGGRLAQGIDTASKSSPVQIGTNTDWDFAFAGVATSFGIKKDGSLWSWGRNLIRYNMGWVYTNIRSPIRMTTTSDWSSAQILKNTNVCIALKTNGSLWSWGRNNFGQLGVGDLVYRSSPVQIGSGTDWATVRCSNQSTFAVKTGNSLWVWGNNGSGQMGLGDATARSSPVQVGALTDWRQPLAAGTSALAIKTNNTLWAIGGANTSGVLGLGDATARSSPVQVGALTDWSVGSAGTAHVLAIKTNGTLWAWGSGANGRLGDGTATTRSSPVQIGALTDWLAVSGGFAHSMAIRSVTVSSGTLWAWGYNNVGRLGLGDTTSRSSPVQVGTDTNWTSVAAVSTATFATKSTGTLWAWGGSAYAQLGLNEPNAQGIKLTPTQVGTDTDWAFVTGFNYNAVAVKTDGRMFGWGRGGEFVLLVEVLADFITSPIRLNASTGWKQVASYNTGMAIRR